MRLRRKRRSASVGSSRASTVASAAQRSPSVKSRPNLPSQAITKKSQAAGSSPSSSIASWKSSPKKSSSARRASSDRKGLSPSKATSTKPSLSPSAAKKLQNTAKKSFPRRSPSIRSQSSQASAARSASHWSQTKRGTASPSSAPRKKANTNDKASPPLSVPRSDKQNSPFQAAVRKLSASHSSPNKSTSMSKAHTKPNGVSFSMNSHDAAVSHEATNGTASGAPFRSSELQSENASMYSGRRSAPPVFDRVMFPQTITVMSDGENEKSSHGGNRNSQPTTLTDTFKTKRSRLTRCNGKSHTLGQKRRLPSAVSTQTKKIKVGAEQTIMTLDSLESGCCVVKIPPNVQGGHYFTVKWSDGKVAEVKCPLGVREGMDLIVVAPGSEPPIQANLVVKQNAAELTEGLQGGRMQRCVVEAFWNTLWPALKRFGWAKVRGVLCHPGASLFIPPGVILYDLSSHLGMHYFHRINDILKFISAGDEYKQIRDTFDRDVKAKMEQAQKRQMKEQRHATQRQMESWKKLGKGLQKSHSRIGHKYQATDLPRVFTSAEDTGPEERLYDQIWDPKRALESSSSVFDFVEGGKDKEFLIYRDVRMECLHKMNYQTEDLGEIVKNEIKQNIDTSLPLYEWTKEEKEQYHKAMMESFKDMEYVSQTIGRSLASCIWYYYHEYKNTINYKVLKNSIKLDRGENHSDYCMICQDGGDLLCCESCQNSVHLSCLTPPLTEVPEGCWFCRECEKANRDYANDKSDDVKMTASKTQLENGDLVSCVGIGNVLTSESSHSNGNNTGLCTCANRKKQN